MLAERKKRVDARETMRNASDEIRRDLVNAAALFLRALGIAVSILIGSAAVGLLIGAILGGSKIALGVGLGWIAVTYLNNKILSNKQYKN